MARERNRQRKLQRKSQKRREQLRRISAHSALPPGAARDLNEAENLIDEGKYDQAIPILEELGRRYPRRVAILLCLADAHRRADDVWSYQAICERIVAAAPNTPELWLALGSAASTNVQIATAHRAFAHVAATWPDHPEAGYARQTQESLLAVLAEECRRCGLHEVNGIRVLLLHDAINLHLQLGQYDNVCKTASQLLAICPTFAPALNNRSQALFLLARNDEAIADSRRVLQFDATNYHALSNLTRYLYLSGRFEDAQTAAAALNQCVEVEGDAFLKKAESFAILGDWQTVHQTLSEGQSRWVARGDMPSLAEHLLGVALANLGDLKSARSHWRRASAGIAWAKENLEDSSLPVGERHGPWAFPLESWVPRGTFEKLLEFIEQANRQTDAKRIVQRHFERYPQLELLAGDILERGDPGACEMLIRLATLVNRPAIFAALKKFALSQRGSDEMRMKALLTLSKAGRVEGQVEIWREGSQRPILPMSQEIYCEPISELPHPANDLMVSAYQAINDGRGADAERMLDTVLQLHPDSVSAQYNRSLALKLQDRDDEALEVIRQIHRARPDYVFARTTLASECIDQGDYEQATKLVASITQMKRLHVSEYAAWCSVNIQLAIARNEFKIARALLDTWEQIMPGDPRIDFLKRRIDGPTGMFRRLSSLFNAPNRATK